MAAVSNLTPYLPALVCLAASGLLLVVELVVADLAALRAGHAPGHPVPANPDRFLFRAVRAHANLNESLAGFIAVLLAAVLLQGAPTAVNAFSALYLIGRLGHATMYYANFRRARSVCFGMALIGILGLGITALIAAIA